MTFIKTTTITQKNVTILYQSGNGTVKLIFRTQGVNTKSIEDFSVEQFDYYYCGYNSYFSNRSLSLKDKISSILNDVYRIMRMLEKDHVVENKKRKLNLDREKIGIVDSIFSNKFISKLLEYNKITKKDILDSLCTRFIYSSAHRTNSVEHWTWEGDFKKYFKDEVFHSETYDLSKYN